MSTIELTSAEQIADSPKPGIPPIVWGVIAFAFAGLAATFWTFFRWLPSNWFGDDTYYAHGAVIPICAGLIVWDRWENLRKLPIKGVTWALLPVAAILYVTWFAHRTDMRTVQSVLVILLLMAGTLFVAGWQWLKGLAVPIGYLAFGFPLMDRFVDTHTQTIQQWSTEFSFLLLKAAGQNPMRLDNSAVAMDRFIMDVGVPCSGMKLLLAVMAISVFFILIAKIKWWGNTILLLSVIPMTLVVNSLRIAVIGWIGNTWGDNAGHVSHDYSGYISLVICFALMMKLTKVLGWK